MYHLCNLKLINKARFELWWSYGCGLLQINLKGCKKHDLIASENQVKSFMCNQLNLTSFFIHVLDSLFEKDLWRLILPLTRGNALREHIGSYVNACRCI